MKRCWEDLGVGPVDIVTLFGKHDIWNLPHDHETCMIWPILSLKLLELLVGKMPSVKPCFTWLSPVLHRYWPACTCSFHQRWIMQWLKDWDLGSRCLGLGSWLCCLRLWLWASFGTSLSFQFPHLLNSVYLRGWLFDKTCKVLGRCGRKSLLMECMLCARHHAGMSHSHL